jgi:hypothetical protein
VDVGRPCAVFDAGDEFLPVATVETLKRLAKMTAILRHEPASA